LLRGVDKESIKRGMVIIKPGSVKPRYFQSWGLSWKKKKKVSYSIP
jgi:translation elongation factor EF-Tu-like GTPase